jgi:hypothetical protein
MSVTIYLTDHNGRKVAFFYRIDNERYLTCPQLIWACRDYPKYQGTAESKEDFMEQCKSVMKELNRNRSLPVRETKSCDVCDKSLQGMENEGTTCNEHNFNR